jgi:hypothetical protein
MAASILSNAASACFEAIRLSVGHCPNLPRNAAQKAALITIPLTGWCFVIAAQPSPDG